MPFATEDLVSENDENWTMIDRPKRGLLGLRLIELRKYRLTNQTLK